MFNCKIYLEDLDNTIENSIGIENLRNSSVLITGATGTIGSFITDTLLRYNQIYDAHIKVYAAGRSIESHNNMYPEYLGNDIHFLYYDMERTINFDINVDYIIHAAGNAHPVAFNGNPVGTITGNVLGTYNLLEYARKHETKRLLYVSSGEIYGQGDISLDEFVETYAGYVDNLSPRSCYPLSKRVTENLCASYTAQYGLETVIVRPSHTYGPQITQSDSRANAQFIRNVLNNQDIVMKSSGEQMRSYNYVADCVSGLFTVLINGKSGEAYNLANSKVRVTIAEFAQMLAAIGERKVIFEEPNSVDLANRSPICKQVLSSKKIEDLGWQGNYSLEEGIRHTLQILKESAKP